MTFLGQNQLGLATVILTALLGLSSTGEGAKQELWLYREDGNGFYFHTHVPDVTKFGVSLSNITKYCRTGMWLFSDEVNYQTFYTYAGNGYEKCYNWTELKNVKSLRHFGANDTATDAISLYSGNHWEGVEIFVDTRAKTDISIPINSLAATGTTDWMLYEGKNFDGKSSCYKVPVSGYEFAWGSVKDLNMITIGSVFKGCDLDKIKLYKESLLL